MFYQCFLSITISRGGSNLIIGPPRDFLMESYITKWGKLKKMVYLKLRYWLLTITCVARSRQFTSKSLFGQKMVKIEKNFFFFTQLYSNDTMKY